METILIKKASGESQLFSSEKLRHSLRRSGAGEFLVDFIVKDIESWIYDGVTSKEIYTRAYALLSKKTAVGPAKKFIAPGAAGAGRGATGTDSDVDITSEKEFVGVHPGGHSYSVAARYKLKKAIMELGPTGHPFEHFVGEVYKVLGYKVEVAVVLQGHCVTHEVDVVATQNKDQYFIECKYYQTLGKNANVHVPLYIRSRVDDIIKERQGKSAYAGYSFFGGVVTNTRFTEDATKFGICSGLHLLSWDFPVGNGLKDIIDKYKIYPITVLSLLPTAVKQQLMGQNIVLCNQIVANPKVLDLLVLDKIKRQRIVEEARQICA